MKFKIKKKIILILFIFINSLYFNIKTKEKEIKIGYTELEYIFNSLSDSKKIESSLKNFEKQLQKQIELQIISLQEKIKNFQKGYHTMTKEVKKKKEKNIEELKNRIKKLQIKSQKLLAKKQIELMNPIINKIEKAIIEISKEKEYTYIFNKKHIIKSEEWSVSIPIILYSEETNNISKLILKKLGTKMND